ERAGGKRITVVTHLQTDGVRGEKVVFVDSARPSVDTMARPARHDIIAKDYVLCEVVVLNVDVVIVLVGAGRRNAFVPAVVVDDVFLDQDVLDVAEEHTRRSIVAR